MEYSYTKVEIPYGFTEQRIISGYKLSNGTLLLPCEQDPAGCYLGGVGLDGIYLSTSARYRPIYDQDNNIRTFRRVV